MGFIIFDRNGDVISSSEANQIANNVAHSYVAEVMTASGSIPAFRAVVLTNTSGVVELANNTNPSHKGRFLGISLASANDGENVDILHFGELKDNSFAFATNGPIFYNHSGELVTDEPLDPDPSTMDPAHHVQIIGNVVESNLIMVKQTEPVSV